MRMAVFFYFSGVPFSSISNGYKLPITVLPPDATVVFSDGAQLDWDKKTMQGCNEDENVLYMGSENGGALFGTHTRASNNRSQTDYIAVVL